VPAGATVFVLFLAFSGAFAKLRKATIIYVMSARLSFRPSIPLAKWKTAAAKIWIFMQSTI